MNKINKLIEQLNLKDENWDTAIIIDRVNQYYLTGTMQDALLIIQKSGEKYLFVRKSFERATIESSLKIIKPMASYKDILEFIPQNFGKTYLETEIMPLAALTRLQKYFTITSIHSIDNTLLEMRAVKSEQELEILRKSGKAHNKLLTEFVPSILQQGMSEAEFMGELFSQMVKLGYHGISRFRAFQNETLMGQFGFGENSLSPTNFDGPGGMKGMNASVNSMGSFDRKLQKGDLVFVDVGFGVDGYHTDKTQVYCFGAKVSQDVKKIHNACMDIQKQTVELLKEGNTGEYIFNKIHFFLPDFLKDKFMNNVKFLGHGIGLVIDEFPILANGFKNPLEKNMVLAIEPKYPIANIGTVGVEDTYVVGGECLTGGGNEIIEV